MSLLLIAILFSGCATVSTPQSSKGESSGVHKQARATKSVHPVIEIAEKLKGKPYRYGGVTPKGFDCSGLVHYAYAKAGLSIPRTTRDQYLASQRLSIKNARPGDLLFFRIDSRKLSHVGLYAGNGRFIHASTTKKRVADASIEDPYWHKRLIGVGRIH
ncbi:MAG: C40 family peptidase [Candidatus Thiodiazotropha sp.]